MERVGASPPASRKRYDVWLELGGPCEAALCACRALFAAELALAGAQDFLRASCGWAIAWQPPKASRRALLLGGVTAAGLLTICRGAMFGPKRASVGFLGLRVASAPSFRGRRDISESKMRSASPTVDAEQHRRNPTRFVPSQPGFLSLSRAEVKQDLRDIAQDESLGGNSGPVSVSRPSPRRDRSLSLVAPELHCSFQFAKESDGVINMERHKMDAKKEPPILPGAAIGIKTLRLRRWKGKPARAQAELHRCTQQVSQLRAELEKLGHQQCQSEEQYLALREHYLTLFKMLREAGQVSHRALWF
eukprot:scaffold2893_cov254-Pinguiococcus_pyrenoidosus.AAC.27